MTLFPFFENIDGKTFLVVGGGKVAKGKVERLKPFTGNILVLAKETDIQGVRVLRKAFEENDLALGDYVIGATDDRALNENIAVLCRQKNIPVNIVDAPSLCTFIFPSLIKRGDLTVGICTGGKSPAMSQYIRGKIEQALPDNIEELIDELSNLRERLKQEVPNQADRAVILKKKLTELVK